MIVDEDKQLERDLWVELVKHRAGYLCEECGSPGGSHKTSAHHINHDDTDHRLANGRALCNGCHAAHHALGRRHTEEARAKMSAAQKGRTFSLQARARMSAAQKEAWKTRVITPEARAVLSENGRRNVKHMNTPEANAKAGETQRGTKKSKETRAKISAALMGNSNRKGK